MEAAETLEQAVVREVVEEAGVPVDLTSVRYHSSQPWPFPRSLMIAFTAEAVPQQEVQQPQARFGLSLTICSAVGCLASSWPQVLRGLAQLGSGTGHTVQ